MNLRINHRKTLDYAVIFSNLSKKTYSLKNNTNVMLGAIVGVVVLSTDITNSVKAKLTNDTEDDAQVSMVLVTVF